MFFSNKNKKETCLSIIIKIEEKILLKQILEYLFKIKAIEIWLESIIKINHWKSFIMINIYFSSTKVFFLFYYFYYQ